MVDVYAEHVLRVLGRYAKGVAEEALEPLGIRATEYDAMETISRYMENPDIPELTVSAIAKRMGVQMPTCSNYIGCLQRSGYVRTTAGNSRLLTTAGIEALEDCRHALRHTNRRISKLFADYGLEDLAKVFLIFQAQEGEL